MNDDGHWQECGFCHKLVPATRSYAWRPWSKRNISSSNTLRLVQLMRSKHSAIGSEWPRWRQLGKSQTSSSTCPPHRSVKHVATECRAWSQLVRGDVDFMCLILCLLLFDLCCTISVFLLHSELPFLSSGFTTLFSQTAYFFTSIISVFKF